jgi:MFS family permease
MIGGSALIPFGAVLFTLLNLSSSPVMAGAGSLIMGFGMGLLSVSSIILIQEIVDWTQRGSVTSSNLFARNLGSMLGATVFGAVLNYGLMHAKGMKPINSEQLRHLLEAHSGARTSLAAGTDSALAAVLQSSLHNTFVLMFAISLAIVFLTIFVPNIDIGKANKAKEDLPILD